MESWGTYLQYDEAKAQLDGIDTFMAGGDCDTWRRSLPLLKYVTTEKAQLWEHTSKKFQKTLTIKRETLQQYLQKTPTDKCRPHGIDCVSEEEFARRVQVAEHDLALVQVYRLRLRLLDVGHTSSMRCRSLRAKIGLHGSGVRHHEACK